MLFFFRRYYQSYYKEFDSFDEARNYSLTEEMAGELYPVAIIDNDDGNVLWHKEGLDIEQINRVKVEAFKNE